MAINCDLLRKLVPLNRMDAKGLQQLALKAKYISLDRGDKVFTIGSTDDYLYYLLDGVIRFICDQAEGDLLVSNSDLARFAFGCQKPRISEATVHSSHALLVRFNSKEFDTTITWNEIVSKQTHSESTLDATKEFGVDVVDSTPVDTGWLLALLNSQSFHQVPPENVQLLAEKMIPIRAFAGDLIIKENEPGNF